MLNIRQFARRTGYSVHHLFYLSAKGRLPPPSAYGPQGAKLWDKDTIDFWRETHTGYGPNGPRKRKSQRRRK